MPMISSQILVAFMVICLLRFQIHEEHADEGAQQRGCDHGPAGRHQLRENGIAHGGQCYQCAQLPVAGEVGRQQADEHGSARGIYAPVMEDAVKVGADVYITGDISHHAGIDAVAQNLMVIDAGHYGIEKIFIPYMRDYMKKQMPGVRVFTEEIKNPFVVI